MYDDDDSHADFAIVRRARNELKEVDYHHLLKHCKGGIADPHWIHRCVTQQKVLAIGTYSYPASFVDSDSVVRDGAFQENCELACMITDAALDIWSHAAPDSQGPQNSSSDSDDNPNEEPRATRRAIRRRYSSTERSLMRKIWKQEVKKGNSFNPRSAATWRKFTHRVSVFESLKH